MKKRYLIAVSGLAMVLAGTTAAGAAEGFYAGALAGVTIPSDSDWTGPGQDTIEIEYDPGFATGVFLGYDAGMFRGEIETTYYASEVDTLTVTGTSLGAGADVTALSFMVNAYWDFENSSAFTPYLGVGIGGANVEFENLTILGFSIPGDQDDTQFAYQFMAGVDYSLTEMMMLGLSYRYFATTDLEFSGGQEVEYGAHNLLVGLRFNF